MGIVFTKYGAGKNGGEIQFDVDSFDYMYDDDTFDQDVLTDFDNILLEHGDVFTVVKQSETRDGQGTISAISETEKRIYAYITDISKRDRAVHEMGLAVSGNRTMYVKPVYTITSGGVSEVYEVFEGDILKDRNSEKWRVIKIVHEPYMQDTKIYKKCVVQNIGLQGSE